MRRRTAKATDRFGPGSTRQGDQRDITLARCNGLGRVPDQGDVAGPADVAGIDVTGLQPQIVDHRQQSAWSVAATEETINVVTAEPCVRQRAGGALGMEPSD